MGASRIEKSTVNMQKFGGTSSMETSVASNSGSVASTVVIEETVVASVTRERDPLLSEMAASMASISADTDPAGMTESTLSPLSMRSNVIVEAREMAYAPTPLAPYLRAPPERAYASQNAARAGLLGHPQLRPSYSGKSPP